VQARMKNPAMVLPDAMRAIQDVKAAIAKGDVEPTTLALVHLRASQINGCAPCIHSGSLEARKDGESEERIFGVMAWREAPYFTEPERAALALTEAVTRLSGRADPVPDEVWNEATKYYDEKGMAALILSIAMTNVYNRFNVSTRQVAGNWR
jgi:AhpD family alkylhydroperoxidase